MGKYVDGFVVPVPKDNIEKYKQVAATMGKKFKELGALEYVECIADDVKPGKLTSFPQSVDLKPNEVVVFSWITYASRADRDRIMGQVMNDPAMTSPKDMPFDAARMIFGGFETLLSL
ncbi:MAG: DUF1428 domain-containing protein [Polyangiales bacterium]